MDGETILKVKNRKIRLKLDLRTSGKLWACKKCSGRGLRAAENAKKCFKMKLKVQGQVKNASESCFWALSTFFHCFRPIFRYLSPFLASFDLFSGTASLISLFSSRFRPFFALPVHFLWIFKLQSQIWRFFLIPEAFPQPSGPFSRALGSPSPSKLIFLYSAAFPESHLRSKPQSTVPKAAKLMAHKPTFRSRFRPSNKLTFFASSSSFSCVLFLLFFEFFFFFL